MQASVTNILINHVGFTDDVTFSASELSDSFQCYHMKTSPTNLDWIAAYQLEYNTNKILTRLLAKKKPVWVDA